MDLHYSTVTTEKHSIVVSTWDDEGVTWCKMTADGRTLSLSPLALDPWLVCCDYPGPLHADDCPTTITGVR
jgi:hypothetical protein